MRAFTLFLAFCWFCSFRAIGQQDAPLKTNEAFTRKTDSLEQLLLQPSSDSIRLKNLIELCILFNTHDLRKSLDYIKQAEAIVRTGDITEPQKGQVLFTRGNIALAIADYRTALLYFMQALRLYERLKKMENVSRTLNNIGVVYSYLKQNDLAERYFKDALRVREENGYTQDIGITYTGIGYILEEKKQYKEALVYYQKALAKGLGADDSYLKSIAYNNLGNTYTNLKQPSIAEPLLQKALVLNLEREDLHQVSVTYLHLSEVAVLRKKLDLAEFYLNKAESCARVSANQNQVIQCLKNLSNVYQLQGSYKDAYETRLKYEALHDSTINDESMKQMSALQINYDLDKKNNQIELLSKDKELALAKSSKEHLIRNILILAILVFIVLAIILVRNIRLKQRLNKGLDLENRVLTQENLAAKYEVLKSKVDPHFLFNSLNTLTSVIHFDKEKAIEFIEHFSGLYRYILETGDAELLPLHEELNITRNYLYLQKVRFGDKLIIHDTVTAEQERFIPAFALQMIVENAIKHNIISGSKKLSIFIEDEGDQLVVRNNLQQKTIVSESTKIGQSNILERYQLIGKNIPLFIETETAYIVKLPLLFEQSLSKKRT